MSKVSAYYHIVFCTKGRKATIPLDFCEDLYRFIWKKLKDRNCQLLRIGGIQNHVHMLINLHPSYALSSIMKDIKSESSGWMKADGRFPLFDGWAHEYYASTIFPDQKESVINYIKTQREHHLRTSIEDEMMKFCTSALLRYDTRDMT